MKIITFSLDLKRDIKNLINLSSSAQKNGVKNEEFIINISSNDYIKNNNNELFKKLYKFNIIIENTNNLNIDHISSMNHKEILKYEYLINKYKCIYKNCYNDDLLYLENSCIINSDIDNIYDFLFSYLQDIDIIFPAIDNDNIFNSPVKVITEKFLNYKINKNNILKVNSNIVFIRKRTPQNKKDHIVKFFTDNYHELCESFYCILKYKIQNDTIIDNFIDKIINNDVSGIDSIYDSMVFFNEIYNKYDLDIFHIFMKNYFGPYFGENELLNSNKKYIFC